MLVKTDGIVLRQTPYSESSIIVKIFTRDFGILSFFIRGSKSKKNTKAHILKPMNQVFISFNHKENGKMAQLSDCQLTFAPDAQIFGIHKSAVAMMLIEVTSNVLTLESIPDIEKYEFLEYSYHFLKSNPLHSNFYISFLIQFSSYLGISTPHSIQNEYEGIEKLNDYSQISDLKLSRADRKMIFTAIEMHYKENLPNFKSLKSIGILEEILA